MEETGLNSTRILEKAVREGASDLFIVAGLSIAWRVGGKIRNLGSAKLMPEQTAEYIRKIYALAGNRSMEKLESQGDDDFSFAVPGLSRFRVNTYKQRGSLSAVIRVIRFELPNPEDIGIPPKIIEFGSLSKGLVVVTGQTGSGKSTTIACMIDYINQTQEKHIITLEDPIEYLYRHNRSIISQREISLDTESYVAALRASLRQSPDIILIGEMRDYETIEVAMAAAETGHLVISTLHTPGAANTIDRLIDVFPENKRRQITVQLSMVLQGVISQQLVPGINGETLPAFEIMTVNPSIRAMIRENKASQIDGLLSSSSRPELISMDASLLRLYRENKITAETALAYAANPETLSKKL